MNKTEKTKHVTKLVITFMEALGYEVVNDELGNLTFDNGSGDSRNYIDYHRTYQDVYVDLKASSETKTVANKLDRFIELIKQDLAL
jgi:hypothetical protein